MDITSLATTVASSEPGSIKAAFGVGLMRKALDQQETSAAQLLATLPKPLPAESTFQVWV